ncbi:HPr kinase/phosphatase C-terminal domain-containing protein [Pseudaminobacter sp. 19-2017]|uniref:HPr kinase/phosphatase C-terminal domain-containing protein n=1 Tax=Pseudaminobacter soli (ex Zhang et al. 2022) TaxID=2831468 RepID=A0A942I2F9_9HYPH|nr:HPr kinase/phosphatase C-terminal domain-containing protein [Pseudaminobacter soli]MBS3648693.1 HPr kinase/phosphatase C-terminal domain-containing protein [Pseudaminobacter soli]
MPNGSGPANLHATAIVLGDRGLLIRGESGSGKTTLALTLIAVCRSAGWFASLVSDDQVLVSAGTGRLVCRAPEPIKGLVETRGRTPQPIGNEQAAVINLVVRLVEEDAAPRYAEDQFEEIEGCRLPLLVLPARNVEGALPALCSWLSLPPFDRK